MEVLGTDEFREWYLALDDKAREDVTVVVDLLEQKGVTLKYPYSSGVEGTEFPMRELRIQSGGDPIRVLYIFDPNRNAVLLIGANKTGDDRFYDRMIPQAEKLRSDYIEENFESR